MKTVKELEEAINEIRQKRHALIDENSNESSELCFELNQCTIRFYETRLSDLTIVLELAKEKAELVKSLIAFEPQVANMASLCDAPKAIVEFRKIITDNEP